MKKNALANRLHQLTTVSRSQLEPQLPEPYAKIVQPFDNEQQWGIRLLEGLFTLAGHKPLYDTLNHCPVSNPPLVEIGINAYQAGRDPKSCKKNFPRAMQYWLEELDHAISEIFKSRHISDREMTLKHEESKVVLHENSWYPLFVVAGEVDCLYPKSVRSESETWRNGEQTNSKVQGLVWQNDLFHCRVHIVEDQWNNPGYWNAGAMGADHYCPVIQLTAAPAQVREIHSLAGQWLSTNAIVYFLVGNSWELKATPPDPYQLRTFYQELNSLVQALYGCNAVDQGFDKRYYSLTDEQNNQLHQRTEKMRHILEHLDDRYAFYVPLLMHNTCLRLCAVLTDLRLLSGSSREGYKISVEEADFRTAILLTNVFFEHTQLLLSFLPEYGG